MYNSDELRLFFAKAKNGTCSHAYIVDGANGIGKLDFALECARAMLCTEPNKPCGYCHSCKKVLSGDHPDVFIIGREKTAAISDVRELIRRSTLKPNDSDKQIFIVCNAGKLRSDSQNALLKLFEEPPESVALFLLTDSRASLLPTVLSRGQRIHLDGMRDNEIEQILLEKHPRIKRNELLFALSAANGNIGEAEKYFSKESQNLRAKAEKMLIFALSKRSYDLASMLINTKFKREQIHALLDEFVNLVCEAQKTKYNDKPIAIPVDSELEFLVSKATKRGLARMGEAASICMMSLENNANVTVATSKLSIDLLSAASR